MLILGKKFGDSFKVGEAVIRIEKYSSNQVKVIIDAPRHVIVDRNNDGCYSKSNNNKQETSKEVNNEVIRRITDIFKV